VRFAGTSIVCNADTRMAEVRKFCKLDDIGNNLIRAAMSQLNLSAWAYHRIEISVLLRAYYSYAAREGT
jgi:magnesium chelatase family protein